MKSKWGESFHFPLLRAIETIDKRVMEDLEWKNEKSEIQDDEDLLDFLNSEDEISTVSIVSKPFFPFFSCSLCFYQPPILYNYLVNF